VFLYSPKLSKRSYERYISEIERIALSSIDAFVLRCILLEWGASRILAWPDEQRHYCLIRDLGLVKGGKGLRHHEVVLDLSWPGLIHSLKSLLRLNRKERGASPPEQEAPIKATSIAGGKAD
jgi:hypothetical protein